MTPRVGVLALQGDYAAHARVLRSLGAQVEEVRTPVHLEAVDGLIIPGGESTTIIKMMGRTGLDAAITARARAGMPLYCTCAGLIVVAREIVDYPDQPRLGLLDVAVRRNAFGRQVDSFEADLTIAGLDGGPMRCVFIRAPWIEQTGPDVEVLCQIGDHPVLVRQGLLLAGAFHPELTEDTRLHELFLSWVRR